MIFFKKITSEGQREKLRLQEIFSIKKIYDLQNNQLEFPEKSYLLNPKRLKISSYEKVNENNYILRINYRQNVVNYISYHRICYEQITSGILLCEAVSTFREFKKRKKCTIKRCLFSKLKIITFPISDSLSIQIKCKKIFINKIEVFAKENYTLLREEDYLQKRRYKIEKHLPT